MPEEIVDGARSLLKASLARSGKWATGVAFFGGVVSDILNPLAPFAAYIALAGAVAALIIAIAIVFRLMLLERAMPALVFASTTAAIAGGIFAVQQANDAQDGIIAGLVPAVAELQQSVGLVAAKVEKIEETVTETQKTVEEVKISTAKVEEKTDRIAAGQEKQAAETEALKQTADEVKTQTEVIAQNQVKQQEQAAELQETTEKIAASIETIADGFEALAAQGGIIADPKRPDEFYHNARLHELSGDMLNARRSYLAFAEFDVDAVDPYLRFATLLRVQDGKAGAREVFGVLSEKNKTLAVKLVHALQFDDQQRVAKLDGFIAANPDYAPAYFQQSEEFSEDRLGFQTLSDKRAQAAALQKFQSYEKDGGLLKYFIDHALLADWLDRSRSRLAALGDVLDPALYQPTLTPMRSNQDWMITVSLPEPAQAISWRLGQQGPFTDTGFSTTVDPATGKPTPNLFFALPASTGADIIGIKYLDQRGREAGPFDIAFRPEAMLIDANKQILEQFWTSWIAFDASGNRGLVYFTHMMSYRCAIKDVRYGFNGGGLDKEIEMPPCDQKNPYALPENFSPYFKVGEDVTSMSVQVTYADGTQSPVREFKR